MHCSGTPSVAWTHRSNSPSRRYGYVDRAVLDFEPLLDVFPAKEKAGTVPFFATAAMLVAYRRNSPTGGST